MIVCPEPLAARAGADIFAAGGNAIDAAVAAAFAQGVSNPLLCGIGGTGLLYYYDSATRQTVAMNGEVSIGSRPVPASWRDDFLGRAETIGRYILRGEANQIGHQSIMTPGFVKVCWDASRRFGSGNLSWSDLLQPAIELARDGFDVYPYIAAFWLPGVASDAHDSRPGYPALSLKLNYSDETRSIYLNPDGSPFSSGDRLQLAAYASTLQQLADAGGDDFYSGDIAREATADFDAHDALVSGDDLRKYAVIDQSVLRSDYRGHEITSPGPPSSGTQTIEMLNILSHFDLAGLGHNSVEYVDLLARVQRASFSDNVTLKGMDFDEGQRFARRVAGADRAAYWAGRIQRGDRLAVRGGAVDPGTTHVTVVDTDRNVVAFSHSIGSLAGSGVVTPGLGFLWNNFLGHFNPHAGHPDSIVPGKRLGGLLPVIVFRDGEPYIGAGAPGGSRIITAVTQSLVNVIDHGMSMQEAVTALRFHSEEEQLVFVEPGFSDAAIDGLGRLGNDARRSTYMSRVQAIRIAGDGSLEAGADPRGGGGVGRFPVGRPAPEPHGQDGEGGRQA
ncbi:MAG TPA: gamma-glutamyltransferase [Thermomicrobiales bacterium]|nr:gamma-glutamyltransferase [Thermomicrobiales bacterium]